MADRGPNPRDTVLILDQLVDLGLLSEAEFQQMHHLGGSTSGFKSYCSKITEFRRNSRNRDLHEKLCALLESYQRRSHSK